MAKYQIIRSKKAISYLLNQRNLAPIRNRAITQADVDKLNALIKAKNTEKTKTQEARPGRSQIIQCFQQVTRTNCCINATLTRNNRKKTHLMLYFLHILML